MPRPVYPTVQPTPSTLGCIVMADCDLNTMEEPEEPVGALDEKFGFRTAKMEQSVNTLRFPHTVGRNLELKVSSRHQAYICQGLQLHILYALRGQI